MRKARTIITFECNRHCDGCCNTHDVCKGYKTLDNMSPLLDYDEVMITGGEPMLVLDKACKVATFLRKQKFQGPIYLYTAYVPKDPKDMYRILNLVDGIHFTLHYECNDYDIRGLQWLSKQFCFGPYDEDSFPELSKRLAIDKRVYDRYDLSNINFRGWDVIRRMEWLPECPLPEGEEILFLDI